jgi:hypothetical protein
VHHSIKSKFISAALASIALALAQTPAPLHAQTLAPSLPHVTGTRKMVLEVIEQLVAGSPDGNLQLLGQGSWLRPPAPPKPNVTAKPGYADPLLGGSSDHDLRLIATGKAETAAEQEALRRSWVDLRKKFIDGMRSKFVDNAKNLEGFLTSYGIPADEAKRIAKEPIDNVITRVMGSINLYPPNQIVSGIVDDASAVARFRALGAVPNLANLAPEGVWGPGQKVTVQQLENFSRARLFYRSANGVKAGFADLVHLAEGHGYYSKGGAANMAYQWTGKALEAFEHGDVRLLGKYLERVQDELKIVKAKGGLPPGITVSPFTELDAYAASALSGETSALRSPGLKTLLTELQFQMGLVNKLDRTAGEQARAMLTAVLTRARGGWTRLGTKMREVARTAPDWLTMGTFIDGTVLAVSAFLVPRAAGSEGVEAAYRQAGVDVSFMAGLGPGFAAVATNMILEDAKDFGYALTVLGQDWEDFLVGISAVKGFEGVTDAKGAERSIEGLGLQMTSRQQIESVVNRQAYDIAQLNREADAQKRERVAQELVKKFTPIVTAKWQKRRNQLMADALDLLPDVEERARQFDVRLDLSSERVALQGGSASVTATPVAVGQGVTNLQGAIAAYGQRVALLGGAKRDKVFLIDTYRARWFRDGELVSDKTSARLVDAGRPATIALGTAGVHDIAFTLDVDVKVTTVGVDPDDVWKAASLFQRHFTQSIHADVSAEGPFISDITKTNEFSIRVQTNDGPGWDTRPRASNLPLFSMRSRRFVYQQDDMRWTGGHFVRTTRWTVRSGYPGDAGIPMTGNFSLIIEGDVDNAGTRLIALKAVLHTDDKFYRASDLKDVRMTGVETVEIELRDFPLQRAGTTLSWEGWLDVSELKGRMVKYRKVGSKHYYEPDLAGREQPTETWDQLVPLEAVLRMGVFLFRDPAVTNKH